MLVSLRLQARVLYEKQRRLSIKLEASEKKAKERDQQLLAKDQDIGIMQETIKDLERNVKLEKVRLNFTLKEVKQAAEKERIAMKNAMEKVLTENENEKTALNKALLESKQEITRLRNRLGVSVGETAVVTNNFKAFYDEYRDLERQLAALESILVPLQTQICELARAMNLEPVDLLLRLEKLKRALKGNDKVGSLKELFVTIVLDPEKDEITPKDSASGGSNTSASVNDAQPGSSTNFEQSVPSCPLSEKEEETKNMLAGKGRMARLKLGFKTLNWPLRQYKPR